MLDMIRPLGRAMSAVSAALLILTATACASATPQTTSGPATAASSATRSDDEYHLAPGDKVHVIVFGEETLTGDYVITSAGNLSFPLVGNLHASDKTVEQLQATVAKALSDGYVNNPRVSMQVVSFRPFYVMGEVSRPGEYPVSTGLTLQQAVATAGGYTYRANNRRAYIKRANETQERLIDLRTSGPVIIHAGDTIRIGERHF